MHIDIDWQNVDTVLLDMDGTLLDLASVWSSAGGVYRRE